MQIFLSSLAVTPPEYQPLDATSWRRSLKVSGILHWSLTALTGLLQCSVSKARLDSGQVVFFTLADSKVTP